MTKISITPVKEYLLNLQDTICEKLQKIDGKASFIEDKWNREAGGGGRTRVLTAGSLFEQAAVNFSLVHGNNLPPSATKSRPELAGNAFTACGVSLIIHPNNPYIPTTHFNGRIFIANEQTDNPVWWFGGGYDLTPYYAFFEDCQQWHRTIADACAPFGDDVYQQYKKWADDYFYINHRQEHRGIGGLFFDDFNQWPFEKCFDFLRAIGDSFLPAYIPIVTKRQSTPYSEEERDFQCYRRGRYVEFNLIYDRGTLFGLQSGGRTESILASLPPEVRWKYQWTPKTNTPEALLTEYYLKPRDWLNATDEKPSGI